ncbi:MAG: ABC transporter ATP-binding protein [Betaproteobacteria bacterium]|nr:MAG: ABC transporter ATP-binding protein [Betaproteobacteria bacterium]
MTLLEVAGIVQRYGPLRALDGVDFAVSDGQFHGLVGPNGSGKSTLMKCIAGAEIPAQGVVRFAGRDITTLPPARRAKLGISLKFQITSVMPSLTVYDNVLLALQAGDRLRDLVRSATRRDYDGRIRDNLERFRLSARSDDLAGILSHGQQQWLEIAMALVRRPRLLLLDEPTAGMSPEERRATAEILQPIREHCAMVIVEHDLDFIRDLCDRLTVLSQGTVVDSGTVDDIQNSDKVREVYLTRV